MVVFAVFLLFAPLAYAMKDPSQVYCESLGHSFSIEKSDGGFRGICTVDGKRLDSWDFLRGEVEGDSSACAKKGMAMRTVEDPERCWYTGDGRCMACVGDDGKETEVTKMLELDFLESSCGDGICGMPENHKTCQKDCPAGGGDMLCEAVSDGACDIDCRGGQDPDCGQEKATATTLAARKPLKKNEPKGCLPMLLAPLAALFAVLARPL